MPEGPYAPVRLEYVPAGERNCFIVSWDNAHGQWRVGYDSLGAATEKFVQRMRAHLNGEEG